MAKLSKDQNNGRYFRFLTDSGSDYTLIPKSAAGLLDIDYNRIPEERIKVETASLQSVQTKKTELYITIRDIKLKIPVLVCEEEVECLLGRKGVFDNFNITFKEREQEVIFEP